MNDVEECAELVDVVQFPRQCRRQVEPEPVDVHLQHPVPQAVHDELQARAGDSMFSVLPQPV